MRYCLHDRGSQTHFLVLGISSWNGRYAITFDEVIVPAQVKADVAEPAISRRRFQSNTLGPEPSKAIGKGKLQYRPTVGVFQVGYDDRGSRSRDIL